MRIRGALTAEFVHSVLRISKENQLSKERQDFKIAMMTLEGGRIGIAAQALGIAQAALDESPSGIERKASSSANLSRASSPPSGNDRRYGYRCRNVRIPDLLRLVL
jgi:butyryl-CoA dehydrogenase